MNDSVVKGGRKCLSAAINGRRERHGEISGDGDRRYVERRRRLVNPVTLVTSDLHSYASLS